MIYPTKKDFLKQKKIKRAKDYLVKASRWMLINLIPKQKDGTVTVSDITGIVSIGAFYFVILIFSFPVALPLPYPPGFPSICGIPIFLLSIQMAINKKTVILPKFVRDYRIKIDLIKNIISKSSKIFKIISRIIKVGRLEFLTSNKLTYLYGLLFIILSICILIPFPGTNFIPAVGIFLCCLGLLFRDGLLVIIGNVVGVIGVLIVYFLSAYFASISAKIIKSIYTKFASITFTETMIAFMIGVFVGMIGMFLVTLIIEFIFKKMNNKFKI
jgi:hypothetical protein